MTRAVEEYGITSCLLYTLAQMGFKIDILNYGMNVVLDTISFCAAVSDVAEQGNVLDVANSDMDEMVEF